MQYLNFKKLVRFIKTDKKKIGRYYKDLDYQFYSDKGQNWLIGIPNSEKIANIGITAHYDTALEDREFYSYGRDIDNENIFWDKRRGVLFGKVNGDDRAGCYSIYEIAKRAEYKPYIMLFDEEESGSIGCKNFLNNYEKIIKEIKLDFIEKCNFFVSLDREGERDAVFYTSNNKTFIEYIEKFGFKENNGLYSDITLLETHFKKCGVNLSIGYKDNHTDKEILDLNVLNNTIKKVIDICNKSGVDSPIFKYITNHYTNKWDLHNRYYDNNSMKWLDKYNEKNSNYINKRFQSTSTVLKEICDNCLKEKSCKIVKENNGFEQYVLCKSCRKKFFKGQLDIDKLGYEKDIDKENWNCEEAVKDKEIIFCSECKKHLTNYYYNTTVGILCEECYNYIYQEDCNTDSLPKEKEIYCDNCGMMDGEGNSINYYSVYNSYLCYNCYNTMKEKLLL